MRAEWTLLAHVVVLCDASKPLKFMHITKTGGTSIEEAGLKLNVTWGMYHTKREKAYGFWHALPTTKDAALLRKYDWFTVVRNPFDRVVSEFWCKWGGSGRPRHVNASNFNAFIAQQLKTDDAGNLRRPSHVGHYVPQTKYLSLLNLGPDIVLRVLRFEHLARDFAHLLRLSGLPNVDMPLVNKNRRPFNVSHLTLDTAALIRRVYRSDFEVFGYSTKIEHALMR